MKQLRRIHLYLGCFFTPLLLFFVLSGWYQTVDLDRLKSAGEAETLLQKMRVVHTDQIYPTNHEHSRPSSSQPFRVLVWVMSAALAITTILGVVLAFRTQRSPWPVAASLALGLLVPVLFLWLGHQH